MKYLLRISVVFLFFLSIFLFHSCKKEKVPTVTTSEITNIAGTTATCGGNITDMGSSSVIVSGICWSTGTTPTLADNRTIDGEKSGNFSSNLSGLNSKTTYNVRAYATNSVGTGYGNELTFNTLEIVTDIDGNVYNTVSIGTQVWMAENLKTTKYNDFTPIPIVTDNYAWEGLTTGAYCDYSNNPSNSSIYGRLYNWYAVDNNAASKIASNGDKNVCPTGWHIPTDAEWQTLINSMGGDIKAGGKLKETGTTHWLSPNMVATNEIGFTALPGGSRFYLAGSYSAIGRMGNWWSSTEYLSSWPAAYYRTMDYNHSNVSVGPEGKGCGFSVRCLREK